jgi:glucose-1-phosphate thymidylyltransferase
MKGLFDSMYKVVIPMAGFGTRMRPHTWSKAKPLIGLAGKTVLDYVVLQFKTLPEFENAEFVFIVGPHQLDQVKAYSEQNYPEKTIHFVVQEEMRGQSDALYQAREYLNGPMLMCFSDTLLKADFAFLKDEADDGVAWVQPVPDPRRFGVARVDGSNRVIELIEKPEDVSNNLAVVGCYYFKNGEGLVSAIEEQVARNVTLKNEFFLVDAINIMIERGSKMRTAKVEAWLDAGKPDAALETNRFYLSEGYDNSAEAEAAYPAAAIVPPVFIGPGAVIESSVIGPYVSIGENCVLKNVVISDAIVEAQTKIENKVLTASLIGKDVQIVGHAEKLNIGDNSWIQP